MAETVRTRMHAVVRSIAVTPGDQVQAGDALVVVESMKTEIPLTATRDGQVATVHVREGDEIREGDPVVELA